MLQTIYLNKIILNWIFFFGNWSFFSAGDLEIPSYSVAHHSVAPPEVFEWGGHVGATEIMGQHIKTKNPNKISEIILCCCKTTGNLKFKGMPTKFLRVAIVPLGGPRWQCDAWGFSFLILSYNSRGRHFKLIKIKLFNKTSFLPGDTL